MPPLREGEPRRATGSVGYGWHITAASRQADLAAEFIDYMTREEFAIEIVAGGDISPLDLGDRAPPMPSRLAGEIFAAWQSVLANGTLLPYLDFAAPNGGRSPLSDHPVDHRGSRIAGAGARPHRAIARGIPGFAVMSAAGRRATPYLYLLPALLFFVPFVLVPFAHTLGLSFFRWDGLSQAAFAGLDNYRQALDSPLVRSAFAHALVLILFFGVFPSSWPCRSP